MKRILVLVAGSAMAVAVVVGTVAAAGPWSAGNGRGSGSGSAGGPVATAPTATQVALPSPTDGPAGVIPTPVAGSDLTAVQASALQGMAEEEKLALDLYAAFATRYGAAVWDNIGSSETTHLAQVQALLSSHGVADPTAGRAAGSFAGPAIQALYDRLVAQGSAGDAAAYDVGRTVELDDIAHLDAALAATGLPADIALVYGNLRGGSYQHLAAFDRLAGR